MEERNNKGFLCFLGSVTLLLLFAGFYYFTFSEVETKVYDQSSNIQPIIIKSDKKEEDIVPYIKVSLEKDSMNYLKDSLLGSKYLFDKLYSNYNTYLGGISLFGYFDDYSLYLYNKDINTYKVYQNSISDVDFSYKGLIKKKNGMPELEYNVTSSIKITKFKNIFGKIKSKAEVIQKYEVKKQKKELNKYYDSIPKKE